MTLCEHFANLRKQANLTREQVSVVVGVSLNAVRRWECGDALPKIRFRARLAALYGVSENGLMHPGCTVAELKFRPSWSVPDASLLALAREGRAEIAREKGFERPIGGTL